MQTGNKAEARWTVDRTELENSTKAHNPAVLTFVLQIGTDPDTAVGIRARCTSTPKNIYIKKLRWSQKHLLYSLNLLLQSTNRKVPLHASLITTQRSL